jgi:hypothetical protein
VTLTGADVRNGTLRSGDVRDESLRGRDAGRLQGRDLKPGSLTGGDLGALRRADVGGAGPAGPAGPAGAPGPPGVTDVLTRRAPDTPLAPGELADVTASCAPGEVAVGGGAGHSAETDGFAFIAFGEPVGPAGRPPADGQPATGWRAQGFNAQFALDAVTLRVHVLCARP